MTSSEPGAQAEQVLARILELLQENRLSRLIDQPLDDAGRTFEIKEQAPMNGQAFHRLLSRFVRHLHRSGLHPVRDLADWEALSEAIGLLESYASPSGGTGYHAALLDVVHAVPDGLTRMLSSVLEEAKNRQRRAYHYWVLASNLDPLAWDLRCEVVRALLTRGRRYLPEQLLQSSPARFADSCELLINDELANDRFFGRLAFSSYEPFAAETSVADLPLPW